MQDCVIRTLEIIERTPRVVRTLLEGLSDHWIEGAEPGGGWSPRELLAHWIHGETEDWIPRMRQILDESWQGTFTPFDVARHVEFSNGASCAQLLDRFSELRRENVRILRGTQLSTTDLMRTGDHPTFGRVTLGHLLSTWSTHDLAHVAQVSRVLAKRQAHAVGAWAEFLPILAR